MTSAMMVPDPDDELSGPFWAAAGEHQLVVQRCDACQHFRWPPLRGCPDCLSRATTWTDVGGTGTIWSYAVFHRVLHPAFAEDVPYTVGVIELDEGPQMIARIVGDDIEVGLRVEVEFAEPNGGVVLPRWRVVDS